MPYIGNTDSDRRHMLSALGVEEAAELFRDIPERFRFPVLEIPPAVSEMEILAEVENLAARNAAGPGTMSFAGAGAYHHFIPSVVDFLCSRGEFTTAYTPYQAEASQGTLQAIFEYQTMLGDLLDMDVVNASHYDGATAMAEAALMAVRCSKGRDRVVFSGSIHPEYLEVARSYLAPQNIQMDVVGEPSETGQMGPDAKTLIEHLSPATAALIMASPDFLGTVHDLSDVARKVHDAGALLVLHTDPIGAGLYHSPGASGVDIVTGEGQPLGIPVSYGGPYLGLFASRLDLVRRIPGRLVGQTVDATGCRGFVLTLNTREQHIRREKATSNICTNQGLMALRAAVYLAAMGPAGLREVAERCYQNAHYAARELARLPGCSVVQMNTKAGGDTEFFKEFVLRTPLPAQELADRLSAQGIVPGVPLSLYYPNRQDELLVAVTEVANKDRIETFVRAVAGQLGTTDE